MTVLGVMWTLWMLCGCCGLLDCLDSVNYTVEINKKNQYYLIAHRINLAIKKSLRRGAQPGWL